MAVKNVWNTLTQVIVGLVVLAVILFVMVLYWPLTQTNARQREKLAQLDEDIRTAQEVIRQKTQLRDALQNDPKTVERFIRTAFRYARSNETIVVFGPAASSPPPQVPIAP
jgi:cytochrome c-type biogenesis protein CcmH/NrfG